VQPTNGKVPTYLYLAVGGSRNLYQLFTRNSCTVTNFDFFLHANSSMLILFRFGPNYSCSEEQNQ